MPTKEIKMRYLLFGIVLLVTGEAASAQDYSSSQYCTPWCLTFRSGGQDCSYNTFEQCRRSSEGVGGLCERNPFLYQCSRRQPVRKRPR
jgi:hypothetical protein